MKYVIYKLIEIEHLQKIEYIAYETRTIKREVLEELNMHDVNGSHDTMESAVAEIHNNADKLKHLSLTILPVFHISWDGEVG